MRDQARTAGGKHRRRLALTLGAAIAGGLALLAQFERIHQVDFMGDESGWIASAGYYTDLVAMGDFSHASWEGEHLGPWGSINPSLGKLLLGAGLRLNPRVTGRDLEFRQVYRFSQSFEWNAKWGNVPYESTVIRAREVTAAFYSLSLLVLFVAVAMHSNVFAGLVVVAAMLTNGWVVKETTPVLTDPYFFLFMFGLVCVGGRAMAAEAVRVKTAWFALAGVLAGAACSVKINGLPLAGVFVVSLLAYESAVRRGVSWKAQAGALGSFIISALAVIYALNPYFWPTDSWRNVLEFPRLFARWPDLFAIQREQLPWPETGRTLEIIRVLFGLFTLYAIEILFFGVGLGLLATRLVRSVAQKQLDASVVPFLFFAVNLVFLLALLPVNYRRYYLLAVASVKVIEAVGLSWLVVTPLMWAVRTVVNRTPRAMNPS